jgi:hypothetical protein
MTAINRNDLRIKNAENLIKSLDEEGTYMFIGKPTIWATDLVDTMMPRKLAGEMSPPVPDNSWREFYQVHDEIIALKNVTSANAKFMIPRVKWTSGVVYDIYRHDYNTVRKSNSGATHLYDAVFYVVNEQREVFVCLDNNNNSRSLVEPNATTKDPFYTSDGYQWMFLYRVSYSCNIENSTNNLIPIDGDTVNYRGKGEVNTVIIEAKGSEYTNNPAGIENQLTYYYCNIVGDGRDAIARVKIEDGAVVEVRVVDHGHEYTYATVDFTANRCYRSISDLRNTQNGLNPLGDDGFRSSVIISPPGGWGYKPDETVADEEFHTELVLARQLGGVRVGIFVTIDVQDRNPDFLSELQFRQLGLIQNIEGHDLYESNADTLSGTYAVAIKEIDDRKYVPGETIIQTVEDDVDPTIKYQAKGTVVHHDQLQDSYGNGYSVLRYIQTPRIHTDDFGVMRKFNNEDIITGMSSGKDSLPIDTVSDTYEDVTFIDGLAEPEYDKYSGMITYLTNQSPILRVPEQTERISFIITY